MRFRRAHARTVRTYICVVRLCTVAAVGCTGRRDLVRLRSFHRPNARSTIDIAVTSAAGVIHVRGLIDPGAHRCTPAGPKMHLPASRPAAGGAWGATGGNGGSFTRFAFCFLLQADRADLKLILPGISLKVARTPRV